MKNKFNIFRQIWLAAGVASLALPFLLPSVAASPETIKIIIGTMTAVMFVLSLPCSLFGIPVLISAAYYIDMHPLTIRGAHLNSFSFFLLGLVQWFWIARIWSPTEPPLQGLDLSGESSS